MQNALGFMPGEHNWMEGKPMPGQMPAMGEKKRGPVMGALNALFKYGAPEAYQAGATDKMNRQIGNALAGGDYGGAAKAAYGAGNWETGMKLGEYGQQQEAAKRKQEAQGVLNLFKSVQPAQISEMAMQDPVGFERMTGMSSEEYMQAGQRMMQAGLSPEQFHNYVIQKAQAELGMEPKQAKYGLDLKEVIGPDGKPMLVQASEAGGVRPVEGYTPPPEVQSPMSTIGKLRADLDANRITQAQFDQAVAGIGKPGVSVTVGGQQQPNPYRGLPDGTYIEPPPGTAPLKGGQTWVVRNGQPTVENAPGGDAAAAAAEAEQKRLGRDASVQRAGRTVVREVGRGLELMPKIVGWGDNNTQTEGEDTTGAGEIANANMRAFMAGIPGSAEYQFMQNIESALSNVGLDRLQEMRENSPTGGALGQVPFQQQQRLEQVLGAFKITMPKPVMQENLKYMNNAYMDIMFGSKEERDALVQQGKLSPEKNDEIQSNYYDLSWNEFGRYEAPPEGFVIIE